VSAVRGPEEDPGTARVAGWTAFSCVLLVLAGALNLVNGLTALEDPSFFTGPIVYDNLTFWGWVFLVWGVLQLVAAWLVVTGSTAGFKLGAVIASTATVVWFVMVYAEPWSALVGVLLNAAILYGLTVGALGRVSAPR
jgi:hypothetical protein